MVDKETVQFLLLKAVIPSVILNFVLNFVTGHGAFSGLERVPVWSDNGLAVDMVVTVFLIAVVTSLILIPVVRRAREKDKVGGSTEVSAFLRAFPNNMLGASLVLGFLFATVFGSVIVVTFGLLDTQYYNPASAIAIKTGLGVLLAYPASIISGLLALR